MLAGLYAPSRPVLESPFCPVALFPYLNIKAPLSAVKGLTLFARTGGRKGVGTLPFAAWGQGPLC